MTIMSIARLALCAILFGSPAVQAQTGPEVLTQASVETVRGPVTNLPLPRYVSTKSTEVNVRRGPSLSHRIDWVFKRRAMPLEIIGEYGHWRRVRDRDGAGTETIPRSRHFPQHLSGEIPQLHTLPSTC